jgi:hypothetical protein
VVTPVAATVANRTGSDLGVYRIPLPPPWDFAPSRTVSPVEDGGPDLRFLPVRLRRLVRIADRCYQRCCHDRLGGRPAADGPDRPVGLTGRPCARTCRSAGCAGVTIEERACQAASTVFAAGGTSAIPNLRTPPGPTPAAVDGSVAEMESLYENGRAHPEPPGHAPPRSPSGSDRWCSRAATGCSRHRSGPNPTAASRPSATGPAARELPRAEWPVISSPPLRPHRARRVTRRARSQLGRVSRHRQR